MGQIAIDQGRAEDEANPRGPSKPSVDDDFAPPQPSPPRSVVDEDEQEDPETPSSEGPDTPTLFSQKTPTIPKSNLLIRRQTVAGAQTVPALPLHLRTKRKSRASTDDPLGQRDAEQHSTTPYQSSPSIPSAMFSARTPFSAMINPADLLLDKYDEDTQSQLLRNHFCLSEVSRLRTQRSSVD
jgi:phosphatidylinositol 4-kinase